MSSNKSVVQNMVYKFKDKGLDILYADCEGYPEPEKVQNVKPDVIAWDPKKELYHLGMVTNSDTISSSSTKQKMKVLAGQMMGVGTSEGKRLPFYLAYSQDAKTKVNEKLQEIDQSIKENVETVEV